MARADSIFKSTKRIFGSSVNLVEESVNLVVEEISTTRTTNKIENIRDKAETQISVMRDLGELNSSLLSIPVEQLTELQRIELEILASASRAVRDIKIV